MAHDGKTQREVTHRLPGPTPPLARPTSKASGGASAAEDAVSDIPMPELSIPKPEREAPASDSQRRAAKRRPAGPARSRIAANDDAPSIGGLIFSLQQKPSNQPFVIAAGASGGWLAVGLLLAWALISAEGATFGTPLMAIVVATVFLPIALFWFLALLAWRTQELKLMSSAMTEVAVRLAEPDRSAEQAAASLGQAVRRQVSFMNEAISRALGRAGELEALVHNEVSALEKSYTENEHKIKGLISELAGERHALVSTTDKVSETLRTMGSEVPGLIDKLSNQQVKLAKIIESAGENLIALETQLSTAGGVLETSLATRTHQLQSVLDDYTVALDATLANRAEALDVQLVERTRALDAAFSERLALFDESMLRSTVAIDNAVNEKARALSIAMDNHVRSLSDTLGRQATNLDDSLMHGIDAVRRTSDNITRQSLRAIEGLSSQADVLKHASENLLDQVSSVTNRFDNQGRTILRAASELESANTRIDTTLQARHAELNDTLQRLSGKADQLGDVMRGYSATVEGSINDAEARARTLIQQLAQGTAGHAQAAVTEIEHLRAQTDAHSRAVVAEFERLRAQTDAQATRALEDMRNRVSGVSQEVTPAPRLHHHPLQRDVGRSAGTGRADRKRDAGRAGPVPRRVGAAAGRGARKRRRHALGTQRAVAGAGAAFHAVRPSAPRCHPARSAACRRAGLTDRGLCGPNRARRRLRCRCRRPWASARTTAATGRSPTFFRAPHATRTAPSGRPSSTWRSWHAASIRRPQPPSGRASARDSAASWCAASIRPRDARPSTTSPSATRPTWTCAAPSTASSPTSRA